MLAVLVRRDTAHALSMTMLTMMLVPDLVVRVRWVLLAVQALSVGTLRLDGVRALFASGGRSGLGSGGTLEDGRVLDERLRDGVPGVVRRAVELVLREGVVVGEGRRVLLRSLAAGLSLSARLGRLGKLLRWLRVGGLKTRSTVTLLGGARETLDVFVTKSISVVEARRSGVRVVESLSKNQ